MSNSIIPPDKRANHLAKADQLIWDAHTEIENASLSEKSFDEINISILSLSDDLKSLIVQILNSEGGNYE